MDNLQSLRFFWPESVLTVAVIAMLVQDIIVRRSAWRVPSLVVGALFWLAATAAATWATPGGNTPLFGGLLQHGRLRSDALRDEHPLRSLRHQPGGRPLRDRGPARRRHQPPLHGPGLRRTAGGAARPGGRGDLRAGGSRLQDRERSLPHVGPRRVRGRADA